MGLSPVFERELKLRSRRAKTWWIRFGIVMFAILGWCVPILLGKLRPLTGKESLLAISIFPMLIALLCGVVTTADCISREKRDGTLDLLLLTRLTPIEILFQKILASTAPVFSGLLAVAPLFAVAILIGGVSGGEAAAAILLTLATAFFSAAVGLLASTLARSVLTTTIITFVAVTGPPLGSLLLNFQTNPSLAVTMLEQINPVELYLSIFFNPTVNVTLFDAATRAVITGSGALVVILVASLLFPRIHQMPVVTIRKRLIHLPVPAAIAGSSLVAIVALLASNSTLLLGIAIFASSLAKLLILILATRVLNSKHWLELVLTTPMAPAEYIRRELMALLPRLSWIVAGCLLAEIVILIRLPTPYRGIALTITLFLFFDAIALALVGLWNGLKCRNVNEAVSFSLSSVILLPTAIAALSLAFGFRTATVAGGLLLWVVLCLVVDSLAAFSARWMLQHRVRPTLGA